MKSTKCAIFFLHESENQVILWCIYFGFLCDVIHIYWIGKSDKHQTISPFFFVDNALLCFFRAFAFRTVRRLWDSLLFSVIVIKWNWNHFSMKIIFFFIHFLKWIKLVSEKKSAYLLIMTEWEIRRNFLYNCRYIHTLRIYYPVLRWKYHPLVKWRKIWL